MQWFIDNHPDFRDHVVETRQPGGGIRRLLSIVSRAQLPRVLRFMLDEREDDGAGIGAGHQTGWTALVAKLLQQSGE